MSLFVQPSETVGSRVVIAFADALRREVYRADRINALSLEAESGDDGKSWP